MKKITLFFALLAIATMAMGQVKIATNGNMGVGTDNPRTRFQLGDMWLFSPGSTGFTDKIISVNTYWNGSNHVRIATGVASRHVFYGNGDLAFQTAMSGNANTTPSWKTVMMKNNGRLIIGGTTSDANSQLTIIDGVNSVVFKLNDNPTLGGSKPQLWFWHTTSSWNELIAKKFSTSSDSRLKTDILPIENATSVLKQLKTYSYYFKSDPVETRERDFGVLAQEIETILPELVSTLQMEDGTESKAVNYGGFIPFLINGFNEQQKEIETLQSVISSQEKDLIELKELRQIVNELKETVLACCGKAKGSPFPTAPQEPQQPAQEKAVLYQNAPNPFSSNTEISCEIPVIVNHAFIYIYNLQGIELKSFPVTEGLNTLTVHGTELPAGMYLYALVVDNEIIDTKRMILTK